MQQYRDPAPCSRVDLSGGEDRGYAALKDIVGIGRTCLIPTARIAGIESPELLDPGTTNYFAAAWQARSFVEQQAGGTIARDWMSLAINSAVARTQNQLHIHVDCLRADVHDALSSPTASTARADMGFYTLVVVGATDAAGGPASSSWPTVPMLQTGAGAEELQDHDSCPQPATRTTAK